MVNEVKIKELNILESIFYYLRNETYTRDSITQTLLARYSGLNIIMGFPTDITTLTLPTLAIETDDSDDDGEVIETFGGAYIDEIHRYIIWGFVGGKDSDGENKQLKANLKTDLKTLLKKDTIITLGALNTVTNVLVSLDSDITVETIRNTEISAEGAVTDAERYRFRTELEFLAVKAEY